MGMPALQGRRWTAREVRQLIEDAPLATPRYELVDGELLVTPSPVGRHQRAVVGLVRALDDYVEAHGLGVVLTSPSDVELEAERLVQPDVYAMSWPEWNRLATLGWPARNLLLAAEVLSPSSSRYDRVVKRPLYQAHVPEYWIVDLDARLVERWRPNEERPEVLSQRLVWAPAGATESLELNLELFFARVFRDQR